MGINGNYLRILNLKLLHQWIWTFGVLGRSHLKLCYVFTSQLRFPSNRYFHQSLGLKVPHLSTILDVLDLLSARSVASSLAIQSYNFVAQVCGTLIINDLYIEI